MAQHDQVIDNATGAAVRADINAALAALFSSNSGPVEPTVKVAGMLWFDTSATPAIMKIRNAANSGWITLLAISAVDMATGFRTGPDRWVVNDKPDFTGRDMLVVDDVTGVLSTTERINMLESDGSIRAMFTAAVGADLGQLTATVHNSSGVETNRWWMRSDGFYAKQPIRFSTGSIIRAAFMPEMAAAGGKIDFVTYNSSGSLDSEMLQSSTGLALYYGDFNVVRSGVVRANFGIDLSFGAYVRNRNSGGAVDGELFVRGDSAYYKTQRIFDVGWFPAQAGANSVTDFPIGTDVFATCNDALAVNRNAVIVPRAGATLRYYNVAGSETALSGTWVCSGMITYATNSWMAVCRRVA